LTHGAVDEEVEQVGDQGEEVQKQLHRSARGGVQDRHVEGVLDDVQHDEGGEGELNEQEDPHDRDEHEGGGVTVPAASSSGDAGEATPARIGLPAAATVEARRGGDVTGLDDRRAVGGT